MEKLTIKDSTVENAIQKGLTQLNTTRDKVDVLIIEEGKKGFFGFGQRDAVVEITLKQENTTPNDKQDIVVSSESIVENNTIEDVIEHKETKKNSQQTNTVTKEGSNRFEHVVTYLENITKEYGAFDVSIQVKETSKKIIFQIETSKAGLLIGKHGKIINALQVLTQTMVYREDEKSPMVVVNIGDYRQKREEKLKEIADRTAKRVLKTNQAVFLEELPAFERKIIHARLSKYDNITTHSEGKEPHRYLVVDVKK